MITLTFAALRLANRLRLPLFKNKHGAVAHARPDGSDWSPAQWFQAFFGEVGEMAQVRRDYEHGSISGTEYRIAIAKEIADAQTYLDLFAQRALDITFESDTDDSAQTLMGVVAELGAYANERKKFDRGDLTDVEFVDKRYAFLRDAGEALRQLHGFDVHAHNVRVEYPDPDGVDLGAATIAKFNEVSQRVGADVMLLASETDFTPPVIS